MKKLIICFILCVLGLYSQGQGTAYITKSNVAGYSQMIRQYKNNPGHHVVYFTDPVNGYIGITDIYNTFRYVQICQGCTISDIEVLGDDVYFCGQSSANNVILGWYNMINQVIKIDSTITGITSLDNIEVYADAMGNTYIAGYGTVGSGYVGIKYAVGAFSFDYFDLPFIPIDITSTDNFVVFAGELHISGSADRILLQPFPKYATPAPTYLPYYSYSVGSTTIDEPYNFHLRVVDIGNDAVATLTHRLESGSFFSMAIREFDVSNAFINYDIPMTAAYQAKYIYSIGDFHDFRYDATSMTYMVFQNYEVSPSYYDDVVTRINLSGGTPPVVLSDYLAVSGQVMKSMSVSDSAMYVVYGYDVISKENVFWKNLQNPVLSGPCLSYNNLPFYSILLIPAERTDEYIINRNSPVSPISNNIIFLSDRMVSICH